MARRGDGICRRGKVCWLDTRIKGERYQISLGKAITRSAALELAAIERVKILRAEDGIGRKRQDISFEKAAELLEWANANTSEARPQGATRAT